LDRGDHKEIKTTKEKGETKMKLNELKWFIVGICYCGFLYSIIFYFPAIFPFSFVGAIVTRNLEEKSSQEKEE
jgi:hypothetical protein